MRQLPLLLLACLLFAACINEKSPLKPEEIKKRMLDSFPDIIDTADIGLAFLSQDADHHWAIAYNREQTKPVIYMYDATDRTQPPHILRLHRPNCGIDKIELNDATYDGIFELVVYLRYDYGLSYQGREMLIFLNPFDTLPDNIREIFTHPLEQVWAKIDTFDADFGTPQQSKVVGTFLSPEIYEDKIQLRGTYEKQVNIKREYKWSRDKQMFELIKNEQLHEATEEEKRAPVVAGRSDGGRLLLEVVAHDFGCRSFVVETDGGYIVPLPQLMRDALYCSPVTAISPDDNFLIFTNRARRTLDAYNFHNQKLEILIDRVAALEGISDIVWFRGKKEVFAACIIANPEEYLYNTRIYTFRLSPTAPPVVAYYDEPAWYLCQSRTGACTPKIEEDFRFNSKGQFVYRLRNGNQPSQEFGTIDIK